MYQGRLDIRKNFLTDGQALEGATIPEVLKKTSGCGNLGIGLVTGWALVKGLMVLEVFSRLNDSMVP